MTRAFGEVVVQDVYGNVVVGVPVDLLDPVTGVRIVETVFVDGSSGTTITLPALTDSSGKLPFYLAAGRIVRARATVNALTYDDVIDVNDPTTTAGTNVPPWAQSDVVGLVADLALKAPLASPTLTGVPLAPTAAAATSTTQVATTAFVTTADALKAPLAAPTFSGTVTLSSAVSQIVPGATSLSLRNNANSADNLLLTDLGAVTIRAGLTVTAGPIQISTDLFLVRDAANVLAQRNLTTAQAFRLYNTTDAGTTNYERLSIDWVSTANRVTITTQAGGAGAVRDLQIGTSGITYFGAPGAVRWRLLSSGELQTQADNVYDLGATAANRPRTIYAGTSVVAPNHLIGTVPLAVTLMGNFSGSTVALASSTFGTFGTPNASVTEALRQAVMARAGTLRNLFVRTTGAQPGDGALVATVRVNGVATALTVTVAAGGAAATFSDVTHSAAVAAGDLVSIGFANASPTAVSATIGGFSLTQDFA